MHDYCASIPLWRLLLIWGLGIVLTIEWIELEEALELYRCDEERLRQLIISGEVKSKIDFSKGNERFLIEKKLLLFRIPKRPLIGAGKASGRVIEGIVIATAGGVSAVKLQEYLDESSLDKLADVNLGATSPDVLLEMGEFAAAKEAVEKLETSFLKVFKSDHWRTLEVRVQKVDVLNHLGEYKASHKLLNQVLPLILRVQGNSSATFYRAKLLGARLYSNLGFYEDAIDEVNSLLKLQRAQLDATDGNLLLSEHERCQILIRLGKYQIALDSLNSLVSKYTRMDGALSQSVSVCNYTVSRALLQLDQVGASLEKIELSESVAESFIRRTRSSTPNLTHGRARFWSENHPDISLIRSQKAEILSKLSKWPEALVLFENTIQSMNQFLGVEHQHVLQTRMFYSECLMDCGRVSEARRELGTLLPVASKRFGNRHPTYLKFLLLDSRILDAEGHPAKAIDKAKKVLSVQVRVLPKSHPHIMATRKFLSSIEAREG